MVLRGASEGLLRTFCASPWLSMPCAELTALLLSCPHARQMHKEQTFCLIISIFKIKDIIEDYTYVQFKICQAFSLLLPFYVLHSLGAKVQRENFNSKSVLRTLHLKEQ